MVNNEARLSFKALTMSLFVRRVSRDIGGGESIRVAGTFPVAVPDVRLYAATLIQCSRRPPMCTYKRAAIISLEYGMFYFVIRFDTSSICGFRNSDVDYVYLFILFFLRARVRALSIRAH